MSGWAVTAAVLAGSGGWVAGFVCGSRFTASKVRAGIERVNVGLDLLEELAREKTGGASATWPAPIQQPWPPSPGHVDLEARAAYQGGLTAWDKAATDRLLAAVFSEAPMCESCGANAATHLVEFRRDKDGPEPLDFFVCRLCLSVVVVEPGVAIQELER